ncbi:hypothetical protein V7S43_018766 [Phytophthora oleae]|uniref:Uncharacterized protein n=1 Tax=Phytophthora oleae TaxID=2107226 RepID=A0ABD3EPQ5_9STRA
MASPCHPQRADLPADGSGLRSTFWCVGICVHSITFTERQGRNALHAPAVVSTLVAPRRFLSSPSEEDKSLASVFPAPSPHPLSRPGIAVVARMLHYRQSCCSSG